MKTTIENKEFSGERPLFGSKDVVLRGVTIHTGESALKECADVEAYNCRFEGRYPFWHNDNFIIDGCTLTVDCRAPLWYSRNMLMKNSLVESPKVFREMQNLTLEGVTMRETPEAFWHCDGITLRNVTIDGGDYPFLHSNNIKIYNSHIRAKYSFQYCKNIEIYDSEIDTKDAFWNSENITVHNSQINGEYLAWHSHNLRMIDSHVDGTQPLCYAHSLVMERCTMGAAADLAFEYTSVEADIIGNITSVKNPLTGHITADTISEIIIDENLKAPGDCKVLCRK